MLLFSSQIPYFQIFKCLHTPQEAVASRSCRFPRLVLLSRKSCTSQDQSIFRTADPCAPYGFCHCIFFFFLSSFLPSFFISFSFSFLYRLLLLNRRRGAAGAGKIALPHSRFPPLQWASRCAASERERQREIYLVFKQLENIHTHTVSIQTRGRKRELCFDRDRLLGRAESRLHIFLTSTRIFLVLYPEQPGKTPASLALLVSHQVDGMFRVHQQCHPS